jgi:arylsulfatase A-like enzyme/Tfp pilus assembly protein PilF
MLAVVAALSCNCSRHSANDPSGSLPEQPGRANVVFITVDTLRADRLPCYGYKALQTPAIDRLARDGILFERTVAPAPMTLPSHCSIFTGAYPAYTGVHDQAGFTLKPDQVTLAEVLKSAGYETAAFVGASILNSRTGLAQGFDLYSDLSGRQESERRGDQVIEEAVRWLGSPGRRNFFAWIHLFDPHAPYRPPEPFRGAYRDNPYDGEIAFVDSVIGTLIRALVASGRYEDAIIVFTSDHGESLGEHGEKTHGLFLYDSTLRVPLIVKAPNLRGKSAIVREQVRAIDIAPTLLYLLSLPKPATMQGSELVSLIERRSQGPPLLAYSETYYPYYHLRWSPLVAVRDERYSYIRAPRPELYDRQSDPQESHDIAGAGPAIAAEMDRKAREYDRLSAPGSGAGAPATDKVERATLERLRSLGYLSVSPRKTGKLDFAKLPDPKDKVGIYNSLLDALGDAEEGRIQQSTIRLKRVIEQEPELVDAHLNLGSNYAQSGECEKAVRAFQRVLELDEGNVSAIYNVALCQAQQGKLEQAVQGFRRLLSLDPDDNQARLALGRAYQLQGKLDAAIQTLKSAVEKEPGLVRAHEFLSQAYETKGWKEAAASERLIQKRLAPQGAARQ